MDKKFPPTIINVSELTAPIIGARDLTKELKESIKKARTKDVYLDFSEVKFMSRSVAHALLLIQDDFKHIRSERKKKRILFKNTNKNIRDMLRLVAANRAMPIEKKIEFNPRYIKAKAFFERSLI